MYNTFHAALSLSHIISIRNETQDGNGRSKSKQTLLATMT